MKIEFFLDNIGADFYTGVPDSQLKPLCNYLNYKYGIDKNHHIIGVNEGNCVAIGAGYHLATGKVPVVYMQNSGQGNIINPVASLLNEKVYNIPMIFVIGWRGEPGVHDEPQHIYQGEITLKLLEDMNIDYVVLTKETTDEEFLTKLKKLKCVLKTGKNIAFVVKKGALSFEEKVKYSNNYTILREEAIEHIIKISGEDPIVSTTGKASRELFEIRTKNNQSHKYDFLTVGSMGHSSSIALGIAINKPNQKIWCIDGDGAMLMHMGAMALIGANCPNNLIHILINNEAHETVGGMPNVSACINYCEIARSCGYKHTYTVENLKDLDLTLENAKSINELSFVEIKCSIGAREDLGRPTTTALENKINFMNYLNEC